MNNYLILIPAYNAGKYLKELFKQVSQVDSLEKVLVVSDGSTDNTVQICKEENVKFLEFKINSGKGSALKAGFAEASRLNVDFVITLDADLQHDPKYIPEMIACYNRSKADLIVGSRLHNTSNMPKDRRFSNKTTTAILSLLAGQKLPDSQSGYRLITTKLLKEIHLTTNRYEMESELLVKSARGGFKIDSVPISTIYNNEVSYMNKFKDSYRFIKLFFMLLMIK